MSSFDVLSAVVVVGVWGVNFYFMKLALHDVSPMLLGFLRFGCVLVPMAWLVPRPNVRWYLLAAYGLTISFGQFGFMFSALAIGMPTGLAALLLQAQVFLTVLIAALLLREQVQPHHVLAMAIACCGLVFIGVGHYRGQLPLSGLLLVLGAALSWACGNIVVKKIGPVNPLSLVVWGNAFAIVPFLLLSLWCYGPQAVVRQISHMGWQAWVGVLFLAYVASLVGYVFWGRLLSRHPAGKITPLALCVPVVALLVAYLFLGESLNLWQGVGVVTVMAGLLVQVFGHRLWRMGQ